MDKSVQNQLTGQINPEAILKVLPTKEKPKRNSYKKASKIVKNSVKGKASNITKEQGFRNYIKYTDPLLLNNNELDQSDLANNLAKILNLFTPNKMDTDKLQKMKKFVATEKPVDANDINTEIKPSFFTNSKKIKELQEKSATKITSVLKGKQTRESYKNIISSKQTNANDGTVIEGTGRYDTPLYVSVSPGKKKKNEPKKQLQDFENELSDLLMGISLAPVPPVPSVPQKKKEKKEKKEKTDDNEIKRRFSVRLQNKKNEETSRAKTSKKEK